MTLAAVLQLATLVAYGVVLGGGKQKRAVGWRVLALLLLLVAAAQCAGMGIVVGFDCLWSCGAVRLMCYRRICMIMMIGSSLGGGSARAGLCARLAGL